MKTSKMSLASIQGKLTRNEMKNLMGGLVAPEVGKCGSDCTGACTASGHEGSCHSPTSGPNAGKCFCTAVY